MASILVAEVAAGRPIDEILVVTFTRKATGTLRERVWRRVGEAAAALAHPDEPTTDELIAHLASGSAIAVLKLGRTFERVRAALQAAGRLGEAWYVERASTPPQGSPVRLTNECGTYIVKLDGRKCANMPRKGRWSLTDDS